MAIGMQLYRSVLYPGAWTYVWDIGGTLNPAGWLLVGPGVSVQLTQLSLGLRSLSYYDSAYHHALSIPAPLQTGSYDLQMDGQSTGLNIIIEDAPDTSTPNFVQPSVTSDPVDDIQNALNLGNVLLGAGTYVLRRTVNVPGNRTIRGYGATLIRTYENAPNPQAFPYDFPFFSFSSAGRNLIEGVTFLADRRPVGQSHLAKVDLAYDLGGPRHENISLRRCVFRNVFIGEWSNPGFLAEDCQFLDGGGTDPIGGQGALFLRCTFRGITDRGPNWLMWNGSGVAVLDCDFFATSQGTVFQANRGDIQFNLVSGLVCDRIGQVYNGCEGISAEAHPNFTYEFNSIFSCTFAIVARDTALPSARCRAAAITC